MSSHWKQNLIVFTMAVVLTHSDGWIKIRVSDAPRVNIRLNLVKVNENNRVARV